MSSTLLLREQGKSSARLLSAVVNSRNRWTLNFVVSCHDWKDMERYPMVSVEVHLGKDLGTSVYKH